MYRRSIDFERAPWLFPLWLGTAMLVGICAALYFLPDRFQFSQTAAKVTGTVTFISTGAERRVFYTYDVNGRQYVLSSTVGQNRTPTPRYKIGEPIQIYYLPADPQTAALADPRTSFNDAVGKVCFAAIWIATMITGIASLGIEDDRSSGSRAHI